MRQSDLEAKRRKRSLNELEGEAWKCSNLDSHLVQVCSQLRKKPIGDFTIEDLRIMIGQQIGIFFLVPIALEILEREPLAEGDYYPGDLLASVARLEVAFWQKHSPWETRFEQIIASVNALPKQIIEDVHQFTNRKRRHIPKLQ